MEETEIKFCPDSHYSWGRCQGRPQQGRGRGGPLGCSEPPGWLPGRRLTGPAMRDNYWLSLGSVLVTKLGFYLTVILRDLSSLNTQYWVVIMSCMASAGSGTFIVSVGWIVRGCKFKTVQFNVCFCFSFQFSCLYPSQPLQTDNVIRWFAGTKLLMTGSRKGFTF